MIRRSDLRLLPSAVTIWALAVLGVKAGTLTAAAAGAGVLGAVLGVALVLHLRRRTGGDAGQGVQGAGRGVQTTNGAGRSAERLAHPMPRALLAHAALLLIGVLMLLPGLHRVDTAHRTLEHAQEGTILQARVQLRSSPEEPSKGPDWARRGLQARAHLLAGTARRGRESVHLPAELPLLLRGDAKTLGTLRAGDTAVVRGKVRVSGDLVVLTVSGVEAHDPDGVGGILQAPREALREGIRRATATLPADEAALVRGITIGDTEGLSPETEEVMRRAGISHLVAVSGGNLAIVIAAVLTPLLLLGVRRRPRLLAAALAMATYVWLVGEEPSVQRAATMATPLLIARFLGVPASPVAALAATVLLWSLLDPLTATSIGFLLSALATGAILIGAPPAARALHAISGERIPVPAALILTVPLLAQAVCTPVLILLAPEISLWAVAVNMLVAPLIAPVTVLGLLSLPLALLWLPAATTLVWVAAGAAHLVLLVAHTADALPGAAIPVPGGATGAVLAVLGLILVITAVALRRSPLVRFALAAVLVAALAPPLWNLLPLPAPQQWRVAACAVGQGDAVLLRSGSGAENSLTVLVDTGPEPEPLEECLHLLKIPRIDLLILTHPHADHVGGSGALRGQWAPREQWLCPLPEAVEGAVPQVPTRHVTRGHRWNADGLGIEVIWPLNAEHVRSVASREDSGGEGSLANDCSVSIRATWADGTTLAALGDLEPRAQKELAALNPAAVNILKVAHHGSGRQYEPLYTHFAPQVALVTVGQHNDFGHPTPSLLAMLDRNAGRTFRTDRDGTVILPVTDHTAGVAVGPAR